MANTKTTTTKQKTEYTYSRIRKDVAERMKKYGQYGDSVTTIIERLMDTSSLTPNK